MFLDGSLVQSWNKSIASEGLPRSVLDFRTLRKTKALFSPGVDSFLISASKEKQHVNFEELDGNLCSFKRAAKLFKGSFGPKLMLV